VLHWGGDTRSLAGRVINWSGQCAVNLSQLTAAPRGDPWLSSGLPKIGDPIYLSKWEDTEAAPTLLHIQSIADVELFGIHTANYGNFILERGPWEQRFGFRVATLRLGPLASAASFAWSEADQAAYGRLLANIENAESAALFQATSLGTDPVTVLPGIADCEKLGLDSFESGRNAGVAFQRIQDCLSRLGFGGTGLTPQPSGPPVPLSVRIVPVNRTDLQITWDPSAAATGYRIYGGSQGTAANTLVATVQTGFATTTLTGLVPGATYCYSVSAFNATGESAATTPVCSVLTAPSSAPTTPSNLQATALGSNSVQLTWFDPINDRDGFYIYEGTNTVANVPASTTQWTITGWNGSVQHCYEVVAFNGAGQSARSNTACAGPVGTVQPTSTVQATATTQPSPTSTAVPATPTATVAPSATPV
ncbi:MAG: hypothetical protein HW416_3478, partial [Chloroflexi bacterium]|nr:hypothetical protein [Chloroflexota bacterium]